MSMPADLKHDRDRYALVPGMTAYRASQIVRRIMAALTLAWVAVGVGVGLLLGAHGRDTLTASDSVLLAVVVLVPVLAVVVLVRLVARRDRAEAAAGYTTQLSGRTSFDQVDPVTGDVIRRAYSAVHTVPASGDPAPHGRQRADGESGATYSPAGISTLGSQTYFPVPAHGRRTAATAYAVAAALFVAILAVIMLPIALTQPDPSARGGLLIAFVVAVFGTTLLVAVILSINGLRARSRIHRISAVRRDDTLFLSPQTPELRQALKAAADSVPHLGFGGRFVVSVGFDGVRLWKGGSRHEPRVTLTWDRIDHIEAGTLMVAAGKTTVSYRTAHVFLKGSPQPIDVPLPIVSRLGQTAARAEYANEILSSMARYATVRAAAPERLSLKKS
jgi:FtsH-binding integral membrane protein